MRPSLTLASALASTLAIGVAFACSTGDAAPGSGSSGLVCAHDGSCPPGYLCGYSVTLGCDAPGVCVLPAEGGICKSELRCSCNGTLVSDCETPGYAPTPVEPPSTRACGSTDAGSE